MGAESPLEPAADCRETTMARCPSVEFKNVDAATLGCLKQKGLDYARQHNFPLSAINDSGSISHSGFSAEWAYDASTQSLTITCTGHPFFVSCKFVNDHIQSGIASTGCLQKL